MGDVRSERGEKLLEQILAKLDNPSDPTLVDRIVTKTLKTVKIDHATLGDNTIVAAVAGKIIKVYSGRLVVSDAVNTKWKSGANDITGTEQYSSKGEGWADSVHPPVFLMKTNVGEALILNLSAGVAVGGIIAYWDDDAT